MKQQSGCKGWGGGGSLNWLAYVFVWKCRKKLTKFSDTKLVSDKTFDFKSKYWNFENNRNNCPPPPQNYSLFFFSRVCVWGGGGNYSLVPGITSSPPQLNILNEVSLLYLVLLYEVQQVIRALKVFPNRAYGIRPKKMPPDVIPIAPVFTKYLAPVQPLVHGKKKKNTQTSSKGKILNLCIKLLILGWKKIREMLPSDISIEYSPKNMRFTINSWTTRHVLIPLLRKKKNVLHRISDTATRVLGGGVTLYTSEELFCQCIQNT